MLTIKKVFLSDQGKIDKVLNSDQSLIQKKITILKSYAKSNKLDPLETRLVNNPMFSQIMLDNFIYDDIYAQLLKVDQLSKYFSEAGLVKIISNYQGNGRTIYVTTNKEIKAYDFDSGDLLKTYITSNSSNEIHLCQDKLFRFESGIIKCLDLNTSEWKDVKTKQKYYWPKYHKGIFYNVVEDGLLYIFNLSTMEETKVVIDITKYGKTTFTDHFLITSGSYSSHTDRYSWFKVWSLKDYSLITSYNSDDTVYIPLTIHKDKIYLLQYEGDGERGDDYLESVEVYDFDFKHLKSIDLPFDPPNRTLTHNGIIYYVSESNFLISYDLESCKLTDFKLDIGGRLRIIYQINDLTVIRSDDEVLIIDLHTKQVMKFYGKYATF